jgi:hypothetical protein
MGRGGSGFFNSRGPHHCQQYTPSPTQPVARQLAICRSVRYKRIAVTTYTEIVNVPKHAFIYLSNFTRILNSSMMYFNVTLILNHQKNYKTKKKSYFKKSIISVTSYKTQFNVFVFTLCHLHNVFVLTLCHLHNVFPCSPFLTFEISN